MKCLKCDGDYVKRKGTLRLPDEYVGSVTVFDVAYLECGECGDILLPYETAKKIEEAQERELQRTLKSLPLGDFLTAAKTAEILGISRQALHKHRRISRGFIYQVPFGEKMVYLKKSVLRFKDTGDGRFLLCSPERPVEFWAQVGSTTSPFSFFADDLGTPPPEVLVSSLVGAVSTAQSRSIH